MRRNSFSLNPYEVLGVSSNASTTEIQAAYRQHALRWHPDRNPDDDYSMRMMQRVNAAWDILKDDDNRAEYDRLQRAGSSVGRSPTYRPSPRPPSGREWYSPSSPPPTSVACPRCNSVNLRRVVNCYSCGSPLYRGREGADPRSAQGNSSNDADSVSDFGNRGGFIVRAGAALTDWFVVMAATFIIASLTGIPVYDSSTPWFLLVVYFTSVVAVWSTTLGKRVFKLKVVRKDGSKIGIGRAFARVVCYHISLLILGIGFLMIAFRADKCGLHDLICDTKVVYR